MGRDAVPGMGGRKVVAHAHERAAEPADVRKPACRAPLAPWRFRGATPSPVSPPAML